MLTFLQQYGANVHSQNGEDGCIAETLRRMGITRGHACEIGANDGLWLSNTAHLIEFGWSVLFVEADYDLYQRCVANMQGYRPNVRTQCCKVDGKNINAFVDDTCDVLSLDTDGSDYEIFCGMAARPKIVIVEIDSSIEPPRDEFNSDGGASYWRMVVAGLERGYFVLCHTGNIVFVRADYHHLFPECAPHPLLEWELYFNRSWLSS